MPLNEFSLSTNTCNSQAYLNLLQQRKRLQMFNIPPSRYNNLANNPYLKTNPATGSLFTKFDLDMKRKAEILKYSNNSTNSKTNNLTKAQLWAQLVNGNSANRYSQAYINDAANSITECPMIYTSTTASDVPGKPILLYDASYVPLYNYINDVVNIQAFGIINSPLATDLWKTYPYSNVISNISSASESSRFNTLHIQNVTEPQYIYSVSIPFTIYIQADATTNIINHYTDPSAIQLYVSGAELAVFYSNSEVPLNSDIQYSYSDVSYNSTSKAMNIAADVSVNIQVNDQSYNKFYAYAYGGKIQISNIKLLTQPGYVYDMQLKIFFNINVSSRFTTYFGNYPTVYFAYLNTTYETTQLPAINCRITNPPQVAQVPQFVLSGVPG